MTRIIVTSLMGVTVSLRIESKSKATFGELVEDFKLHGVPKKHRSFDRESREWVITILGFAYLEAWLSRVRLNRPDVEIVRDGKSYSRLAATATSDEVESAYRTLYLLPSAPEPVVIAAHKALLLLYHPDKPSGDEEKMKEINAARDLVLNKMQGRVA